MDLDDIYDVTDYSQATLRAMIARLRQSRSQEQFVYRETELDEMWRLVDIDLKLADSPTAAWRRLTDLRTHIARAHDLVGMDDQPMEAAQVMETALQALIERR